MPNEAHSFDPLQVQIVIQGISFFVQLMVLVGAGVMGFQKHNKAMQDAIAQTRIESAAEISRLRNEIHEENRVLLSQFGDSIASIRQKVQDVEIWSRDTFVREKDFRPIVTSLQRSIEALGEKFDMKLDKIEVKIDRLKSD